MSLSKSLLALGSLFSAQQAGRVVHRFETDGLFGLVGLQRRRSTLRMIAQSVGLVTLGAAVGAGVALMIAPTSGGVLRRRLTVRANQLATKLEGLSKNGDTPSASDPDPMSS